MGIALRYRSGSDFSQHNPAAMPNINPAPASQTFWRTGAQIETRGPHASR
jgi:hypothetical protein